MKVDYDSKDVAFVDFETQSAADLRTVGGRAYASDPSTRVAMCAFLCDRGRVLWVNSEACPHRLPNAVDGWSVHRSAAPPEWVLGCRVLCAHNAFEFDAHVWRAAGLLDVAWRDTLPLCRAASLPGGLDAACQSLLGRGKVDSGTAMALSQAKIRNGRVEYAVGTAAAWVDAARYCCADVELLAELHNAVLRYAEPSVLRVHQAVNDRGFPVDVALAARLALLQDELAVKRADEICGLTEGDLQVQDARSVAKVKKWLGSLGCTLPMRDGRLSLDKRDLRLLFEDPQEYCGEECEELVVRVLKLREDVSKSTVGKSMRMIEVAMADGRARGQHVYHKAHTGRFAGREVQPHNFPRGVDGVDHGLARSDLTLKEVEAEAVRLDCRVSDVLSTLLRPCIGPGPLSVADYGQVEARGVCWIAREDAALTFFRDLNRDYYTHYVAPKIYGDVEIDSKMRWNAKQTGLGAGYGMSGRKMRAMLETWGVDTSGVSPEGIIDAYRRSHLRVVAAWKQLDAAMMRAAENVDVEACGVKFRRRGSGIEVVLPSGRAITYRDARVEMLVPAYCVQLGLPPVLKPTVTYRHPNGYRSSLYGGREMENVVQGLTRDLLCDGMVRAEDEGRRPCMHVHDELVCESDDAAGLAESMSRVPEWADGFPLMVEAFCSDRYFKKPPKGTAVHKRLGGQR